MYSTLFFVLFILLAAEQRDIYDIIKNKANSIPKDGPEHVVGIYQYKPSKLDGTIEYETFAMKSAAGYEMTCLVPQLNGQELLNGTIITDPEIQEKEPTPRNVPLSKTDFFQQAFIKRKACFTHRQDFWSYEVCRKKITQFHGVKRSPSFSLGDFDGNYDESKPAHKQLAEDVQFAFMKVAGKLVSEMPGFYINSVYLNGDDGRQTLVTWFCEFDNSKKDGSVVRFEESQTHRYSVFIQWKALCDATKKKTLDPPKRDPLDLSSFLTALENKCLQSISGWWTYEFCYQKEVRQFHEEKSRSRKTGKVISTVTVDYTLGKAKKPQKLALQTFSGKKSQNFVEEIFDQGTTCDLTQEPRVVVARYRCQIDDKVLEVHPPEEVSSCQYTIDVSVPELCEHPEFSDPHTLAHEIVCYPKGVEEPFEGSEDDELQLTATASDGSFMTDGQLGGILQELLAQDGLQDLMNSDEVTTINLEVDADMLDELMNNPDKLAELLNGDISQQFIFQSGASQDEAASEDEAAPEEKDEL